MVDATLARKHPAEVFIKPPFTHRGGITSSVLKRSLAKVIEKPEISDGNLVDDLASIKDLLVKMFNKLVAKNWNAASNTQGYPASKR